MKLESTVMPKPSPLLDNTRSLSPYILPLHTCNRLSEPVARTTMEETSKIQERRLARSQHSVYNVRKALPGLLTAFNLEYAESSKEMVLVPMHLCMCIHTLNHYAQLES